MTTTHLLYMASVDVETAGSIVHTMKDDCPLIYEGALCDFRRTGIYSSTLLSTIFIRSLFNLTSLYAKALNFSTYVGGDF